MKVLWGEPFAPYVTRDIALCAWCERWDQSARACRDKTPELVATLLSSVYGSPVYHGRCEQGDSLVHRSELFMGGVTRARSLRRCHYFERAGEEARYLGCAELRAAAETDDKPIASAFLKLPLRMVRSGVHTFPLAWYYATCAGITSFLCTPYTMHSASRGYMCAQACVYLALLMMARHEGRVYGPTTITALAGAKLPPNRRSTYYHDNPSPEDFDVWGLTPEQVKHVGLRAGLLPHYQTMQADPVSNMVTQRLLAAYLTGGFPIILFVDIAAFYSQDHECAHYLGGKAKRGDRPENHAVVAVGGSNLDDPDLASSTLVVHDTAYGPYEERSFEHILRACAQFRSRRDADCDYPPKVGFVAYCVPQICLPAYDAWRAAMKLSEKHGGLRATNPLWRVRLCEAALVSQRYFGRVQGWQTLDLRANSQPDEYLRSLLGGVTHLWLVEQFASEAELTKRIPWRVIAYDAGNPDPSSGLRFVLTYDSTDHLLSLGTPSQPSQMWLALTGEVQV